MRKQPSIAEIEAELAKLELRPDAQAKRKADKALRQLLGSPPEPFTPKAKQAKPSKPAK